jgi:MFS family permease
MAELSPYPSELDNYSYQTYFVYAVSDFEMTAHEAALTTAANLAFSLSKPVWAKMSDGTRKCVSHFTHIHLHRNDRRRLRKELNAFAAGTVLRAIGITALNSLNAIVISDLTSTRARGFSVNIQFFPVLILPWCASYMVSSAISNPNIGWAWGIDIVAIIYPFGIGMITAVLLTFERRASKLEIEGAERPKVNIPEVVSNMDLAGLSILIVGCAFLLVPLSMPAPWMTDIERPGSLRS